MSVSIGMLPSRARSRIVVADEPQPPRDELSFMPRSRDNGAPFRPPSISPDAPPREPSGALRTTPQDISQRHFGSLVGTVHEIRARIFKRCFSCSTGPFDTKAALLSSTPKRLPNGWVLPNSWPCKENSFGAGFNEVPVRMMTSAPGDGFGVTASCANLSSELEEARKLQSRASISCWSWYKARVLPKCFMRTSR